MKKLSQIRINLAGPLKFWLGQVGKLFYALLLLAAAGVWVLSQNGEAILTRSTERVLNQATRDLFSGSVRIRRVSLDRYFQLRLEGLEAALQTRRDPVPLFIERIESEGPVFSLLGSRPVLFHLQKLVFSGSVEGGISGDFFVRGGKDWAVDFRGRIDAVDLREIVWLDPDHLKGSTGRMTGTLCFQSGAGKDPDFELATEIKEPGGSLQAQFFDLLLPLLPAADTREAVNKMASGERLIRYASAELRLKTVQADTLKGDLRIRIPAYNLNLNVNLEIRVDKKNTFVELAQLLGFLEVRTA